MSIILERFVDEKKIKGKEIFCRVHVLLCLHFIMLKLIFTYILYDKMLYYS